MAFDFARATKYFLMWDFIKGFALGMRTTMPLTLIARRFFASQTMKLVSATRTTMPISLSM